MNKKTAYSRRKFLGQTAALSAFFILPRHVLGGKGFIAPSDRLNLGFIGAGRQAITLQKAFIASDDVIISAVTDVYRDKTAHFIKLADAYYAQKNNSAEYRACEGVADFTEMLNRKDIDAVVIATPDHWHAIQAVLAARAGKDIYCEKPLSLTIGEGRKIVDAVIRHKRIFQTGSMQRSAPEFRRGVELIRNGYLGEIKKIQVSVGGPPVPYNLPEEKLPEGLDWKRWLGPVAWHHYNHELNPAIGDPLWARWRDFKEFGGGGMTDWGAHMFDIAQWAMDMDRSGPVDIHPPDNEHAVLTFRYANGVVMTHEDFGKKNAIRFTGTKGVMDIQRRKLSVPESLENVVIGNQHKRVHYSDNHYRDWISAIRTRGQVVADAETGHRTATVCTLGNIAYDLKRPLRWDSVKEKFISDDEANRLLNRSYTPEFDLI